MILSTYETKKLEAFSDIFKGTCELNGFDIIKVNGDYSVEELKNIDSTGKFYFIEEKDGKVRFRATTFNTGTYDLGEMINMVIKVFYNAYVSGVEVVFDENDRKRFEDIIEDLDVLDINCRFESLKGSTKDRSQFEVRLGDEVVGGGYIYGCECIEIYIDYDLVKEHYIYKEEKNEIDAYITPKSKTLFSDAFIICSNLKDSGLRVEVDYSLGEAQLGDSSFWIELDEKLLESYLVNLMDRKTHYVKKVFIDDLAQELMFI